MHLFNTALSAVILLLLLPFISTNTVPVAAKIEGQMLNMRAAAGLLEEGISAPELHKRDCLYRRTLQLEQHRRDCPYKQKKRQDCPPPSCPPGCVPPC